MALPAQIQHRTIRNTALPYDPFGSPIKAEPVYLSGSNVMTSERQFLERRPGFPAFETTPTAFAQPVRRIYAWHRWNGVFFIMANTVGGGQSIVYKLKVGTDASFISLFTSTTATAFDFVVSNNQLFFSNGTDKKKWDGTTLTNWGITAPSVTPTVSLAGTGLTATTGYQYVYCYHNSATSHVSSPSPTSASTGAFTNQQVTISVTASTDAQVTGIKVFRTTDGGGGIFYEISGSPFANTTGNVTDTTADTALNTSAAGTAPVAGFNDPPPGIQGLVWYANRIWGFVNNRVYFSGWEEIVNGTEEECFNTGGAGNFFTTEIDVTGIAALPGTLLIFTPSTIHRVQGDSLDTFQRDYLVKGMGTRAITTVATFGRVGAWLNNDNSIMISDGFSVKDISTAVRSDLLGTDPINSYLSFFNFGLYQWLVLMDPSQGGNVRVYDLDRQQWMPPWAILATAMVMGETAKGIYQLFMAKSSNNKVLSFNPLTSPLPYQDDGASYTANVSTNMFDLVRGGFEVYTGGYALGAPPGHIGEPEYISVESNSIQPDSVTLLTDEDPFTGTYKPPAIVQLPFDAPLRTQGVNLIEKWYYFRSPAARRCSIKFSWNANNTNFRLYSFDVAYYMMQGVGQGR